MTLPHPRTKRADGCRCDPPWPLLYTRTGTSWQQVFPSASGRKGPAWCLGCGARYSAPWQLTAP
jgi:hypothetical protein